MMNEEFLDQRSAALAAVMAASVGDAVGYQEAVTKLSPIARYRINYDVDADVALFSGSGVVS